MGFANLVVPLCKSHAQALHAWLPNRRGVKWGIIGFDGGDANASITFTAWLIIYMLVHMSA